MNIRYFRCVNVTLLRVSIRAFAFLKKSGLSMMGDVRLQKPWCIISLAELKVHAESDKPLTSYLAVRFVCYTIGKSKNTGRGPSRHGAKGVPKTRHESGWTNYSQRRAAYPFYLKDDTGVIRIIPMVPKYRIRKYLIKPAGCSDPLYFSKALCGKSRTPTMSGRFVGNCRPASAGWYVMGQGRERLGIVSAEMRQRQKSPCS